VALPHLEPTIEHFLKMMTGINAAVPFSVFIAFDFCMETEANISENRREYLERIIIRNLVIFPERAAVIESVSLVMNRSTARI
jgi:hypothetical protein